MRVIGTFIKKADHIFQTRSYIQWGESEEVLGTVILKNPENLNLQMDDIVEGEELEYELELDSVLEVLIGLVEKLQGQGEVNGRLCIYYIFPLQKMTMSMDGEGAPGLWEVDDGQELAHYDIRLTVLEHLLESSWILLGWGGSGETAKQSLIKEQWIELIKQSKTPVIGKLGKGKLDYEHPKKATEAEQAAYTEELEEQYDYIKKQLMQPKGILEKAWRRHITNFDPVEVFAHDKFMFQLYELNEQNFETNYRYRLICFYKGFTEPIFSLNCVNTDADNLSLGMSTDTGDILVAGVPSTMTLVEFREWAIENIPMFLHDIDLVWLNEQLKHFKPIKQEARQEVVQRVGNTEQLDEVSKRRMAKIKESIREYHDMHVYIVVKNFEEKYRDFTLHSLLLNKMHLILLECGEEVVLVALEFPKKYFAMDHIVDWLQMHDVYIGDKSVDEHTISMCHNIIYAMKFMGHVVAIYQKGNKRERVIMERLKEVLDQAHSNVIETKYAKAKAKGKKQKISVMLNGQLKNEFSRIDFNRNTDMIIANGNVINADYLEDWHGNLAFFRQGEVEPIAMLYENKQSVKINFYPLDEYGRICVIEHEYEIDTDRFEN